MMSFTYELYKLCLSSIEIIPACNTPILDIHSEEMVATLKRNLETVVSKKADFTKAPYHNEAVELFTAILKNCE